MPWPIYPSRYAPGAPDSTDLWTDVIGQVQTLSNISGSVQDAGGSPLAVNGSFEADTNGTNPPTGWISTASGNVTNTNQDHGFQSYVVTQNTNGSGAGYLQSANFMNVSERMAYRLQWEFMTSQTNVFHQAQVLWYDHNTNLLGNTNVFTQSGGFTPNIWTEYGFQVTPQASAVLAKLQFTLGSVGVLPASQASLYLDNISTILRPPYSNVASFSNTNVWHVPNGTFRIWVKAVGGGGGGSNRGRLLRRLCGRISGPTHFRQCRRPGPAHNRYGPCCNSTHCLIEHDRPAGRQYNSILGRRPQHRRVLLLGLGLRWSGEQLRDGPNLLLKGREQRRPRNGKNEYKPSSYC